MPKLFTAKEQQTDEMDIFVDKSEEALDLSKKSDTKEDFISFDYYSSIQSSARTPRNTSVSKSEDKSSETRMKTLLEKLGTLLRSKESTHNNLAPAPIIDKVIICEECKIVSPSPSPRNKPLDEHNWFIDSKHRHEYYNPFRGGNIPSYKPSIKIIDNVQNIETIQGIHNLENFNIEKMENNGNAESVTNNILESQIGEVLKDPVRKICTGETVLTVNRTTPNNSAGLKKRSNRLRKKIKNANLSANALDFKNNKRTNRGSFIRIGLSLIYVSVFLILFASLTIPKLYCLR